MKKQIIDLVDEYKGHDSRIRRLENMMNNKELSYYFVSAYTDDDNKAEIDAEDWSNKEEKNRFKKFLLGEIEIENKHLKKINENIIKEFKE